MGIRSVKEKREREAKAKGKKLLIEFLVFIISTLIRYGIQMGVFFDAIHVHSRIQLSLADHERTSRINVTVRISYCSPKSWKIDEITQKLRYHNFITYTFGFFVFGSIVIASINSVLWILLMYRIKEDTGYPEAGGKQLASIVRIKIGFVENMLHDIPLSIIAVTLLASRLGSNGLTCLICAITHNCYKSEHVTDMTSSANTILGCSLFVIGVTTMWKGTTVFFQWSYTKECPLVTIRVCTSIFVGLIYSVLVLTPALFVTKYQLRSVINADVIGLIDKLIIIGVIEWCILLFTFFCCPLIKAIS